MNLINRRFVPFWYDIAPPEKNAGDGWAYDAAAVEAIGDLHKRKRPRGGRQDKDGRVHADSYPAVLIIGSDGKWHDKALALEKLKKRRRAELLYLKGRAQVCLYRTEAARATLAAAAKLARPKTDLADAITVAAARAEMQDEAFAAARKLLAPLTAVKRDGSWVGAAIYYAGLCEHRLGNGDAAKELWRRHRKTLPRDRLARRSAASLGLPEAEAFKNQQLIQRDGWW